MSTPVALRTSPRLSTPHSGSTPRSLAQYDTPTRKAPHCSKCGRLRAGHPRSGCPFTNAEGDNRDSIPVGSDLEGRLESLNLEVPNPAPQSRPRPRQSLPQKAKAEETLASLSSSTNDVLDGLLQPGIMADDLDQTDNRYLDGLNARNSRIRTVMPGSLMPPTQSQFSSFALEEPAEHASTTPILSPVVATAGKALLRTLSMEERESFLTGLMSRSKSSPATVISLPMEDLPSVQSQASKIGFHSRVLEPTRSTASERWLIIGRDHGAVEKLYETTKVQVMSTAGRGLPLAAGAAVGAVSAVAALAFA